MEKFPSAGKMMFQENDIPTESQDELHEKQGKNEEKLKKILKKMVLWGMITGSALIGTKKGHEAGRVPGFGQGIEPETTTISASMGSKEGQEAEIFYAETPESIGLSLSESESAYLSSVFGEDNLNELKYQWFNQSWYEKHEHEGKKSKNTAIENFEKIEMPPKLLKKIWTETYPKNWVDTEVDSIIFEDYDTKGRAAATATRKLEGPTTIVFYKDAGKMLGQLNEIFSHESGHANDWKSDNTLSIEERKKLLIEITKRYFTGKNIYHSDYVESIKNEDTHSENYRKVTEYWAEICEEYFDNPQWLKENHPEDYKIVDQYVKKQDRKFNPTDAKLKRESIILSYDKNKFFEEQNQFFSGQIELYDHLPQFPPEYRQKLMVLMDECIQKQKKATDLEEMYKFQHEFVQEQDEILDLDSKNKLLARLPQGVKQEISLLEQNYERLRLEGNMNNEQFLHFLDKKIYEDMRSIREKLNLNKKDMDKLRNDLGELRRIIFREFLKNA